MLKKTLSKDIGKLLNILCNILNYDTESGKNSTKFASHCLIDRSPKTDLYRCIGE